MEPQINSNTSEDCSSIQLQIVIDESWIDSILAQYRIDIPINDKISLTNLRVNIGEGELNFQVDLKDKNSSIELNARPHWDAARQFLAIEDLKMETSTKNVFLKSAGWIAQNFLGGTIDRKIEEQANKALAKQIEKLKEKPVEVPIPKGGKAKIMITSIQIHELIFVPQAVHVRATVDATFNVHLTINETDQVPKPY